MTNPVCEPGQELVLVPAQGTVLGSTAAARYPLAAITTVMFDIHSSSTNIHAFAQPSESLYVGLWSPSIPSAFSDSVTNMARVVTFEGGSNEARTRQLVGRKIDVVWRIRDGWQGPGSLAPSRIARELYLSAVQVLPPRCLAAAQPTPTRDGGLHMEWTGHQNEYSAEITSEGHLVLNVFAPDADDDSETVVDQPTREDLVAFICRGV